MEGYNGCSVPQYTAYPRVTFSRKGVQRVPPVFPDDMGFDSQEFEPRKVRTTWDAKGEKRGIRGDRSIQQGSSV
jgi:hypothetical protein